MWRLVWVGWGMWRTAGSLVWWRILRAARVAFGLTRVAGFPRADRGLIFLARFGLRDQVAAAGKGELLDGAAGRLRARGIGRFPLDIEVLHQRADRGGRRRRKAQIAVGLLAALSGGARGGIGRVALRHRRRPGAGQRGGGSSEERRGGKEWGRM